MESTLYESPARAPAVSRERIWLSLVAFISGSAILWLAGLVQFADRLPEDVQVNPLFALAVQGYSLIKPVLTGYSGPRFLGLLGVGLSVYWMLPAGSWQRAFLLAYSALMAMALVRFPILVLAGIAVAIIIVHGLVRAAVHSKRAALAGIVGIAVTYSLITFLPLLSDISVVNGAAGQFAAQHLVLQGYFMFLPIKLIHYLWDVAAGRAKVYSLGTFASWVLFFPSFRNAPFERIQSFARQSGSPAGVPTWSVARSGLKRLLVAAVKGAIGCLIVSYLSPMSVWAAPARATGGQLWLAAYGYAVGMYLEFAGFADAMIGASGLLGYHLSENFDRPYLKHDVRGFWRGWNVTASHWLRDYVYIPLGGSQRGNVYFNLLATMLVTGLWHAPSVNFLIWGAWHGLGLIVSRYLFERRREAGRAEPAFDADASRLRLAWLLGALVTFHFVTVGWLFHHNGYYGVGALDSLRMLARMTGLW